MIESIVGYCLLIGFLIRSICWDHLLIEEALAGIIIFMLVKEFLIILEGSFLNWDFWSKDFRGVVCWLMFLVNYILS